MTLPIQQQSRIVVGYHGCDQHVLEDVLLRGASLKESSNKYDWLGKGVYFWEFSRQRATDFAEEQRERGKIVRPAVLGAYIHLGRCFDLTDTLFTEELKEAFPLFKAELERLGEELPANRSPRSSTSPDILLRYLDCAVLDWYLDLYGQEYPPYQSVRGVFVEGEPVFEGACIHTKTHIQLAIRDPACILGYFKPA